jgi:peptide-methionine (R)-S-oxide reductase
MIAIRGGAIMHRRHVLSAVGALTLAAIDRAALAVPPRMLSLSPEEWRARLTPEQYAMLRQGGTEEPYSSPLVEEKRRGVYACGGCRLPLFSSSVKYDSRTGWPSFFRALPDAVREKRDRSEGLIRTKVECLRCAGHLGHVFGDGPLPTRLRYCVNGAGLTFIAAQR